MILKQHLSGEWIVYEPLGGKKTTPLTAPSKGREQGSLINQQKRKIADACEYLRVSLSGKKDRCPLIFTLTTPGYTDLANEPKFVSAYFENMRVNYGLGEYVWVREVTKRGFPHFHCIGDWHTAPWFFEEERIYKISKYWSSLFGSDADNSVWLGGYWYGKRIYHLRHQSQARYLCKYLGKQFKTQYARPVPVAGIVPSDGKRNDQLESLPLLLSSPI